MQINTGTVSILSTNLSLVIGNNVDWEQVLPGNLFICNGKTFQITFVDALTDPPTLSISPVWPDAPITNAPYTIVRDFSANFSLPLLNEGDLEAAAIWTRTVEKIDSLLGTSGSTTSEITIGIAGTSFQVGNMVGFDGTGWFLCQSSTEAKRVMIGCVTQVLSDRFMIKTEGRITGIVAPLVSGAVHYLRDTPVSGGNLTDSLGAAGTVQIPVLVADSVSSGYLLNLASSISSKFTGPGSTGLVPNPGDPPYVALGYVLKDDGTWGPVTMADNSVTLRQLKDTPTTINWTNWLAGTDLTLSVYHHISNLNNRLSLLDGGTGPSNANADSYKRIMFSWLTTPSGQWSWTPPTGVTWAIVTLISASPYLGLTGSANSFHFMDDLAISNPLAIIPAVNVNVLRVRIPVQVSVPLLGDLGSRTDTSNQYPGTLWRVDRTDPNNHKLAFIYGPHLLNEHFNSTDPFWFIHDTLVIHAQYQINPCWIYKTMKADDLYQLVQVNSTIRIDDPTNASSSAPLVDKTKSGNYFSYSVRGAAIIEFGAGAVLGGI